jgi:hypothetical protein
MSAVMHAGRSSAWGLVRRCGRSPTHRLVYVINTKTTATTTAAPVHIAVSCHDLLTIHDILSTWARQKLFCAKRWSLQRG